jgi:hypothetical protein
MIKNANYLLVVRMHKSWIQKLQMSKNYYVINVEMGIDYYLIILVKYVKIILKPEKVLIQTNKY